MHVFHYVAMVTRDIPPFTSAIDTTHLEQGDAGAIYYDIDFDPTSLLLEESVESTADVLLPHVDPIEAVEIESGVIDQVYVFRLSHL